MTKTEFLTGLQRALMGKMNSEEIAEHVSFYQEYIEIQVRKGKAEEEIIEELGTPAFIAKSILTAAYDSKVRLDETRLYSIGTRIKSVCAQVGTKAGRQLKTWFDNLQ